MNLGQVSGGSMSGQIANKVQDSSLIDTGASYDGIIYLVNIFMLLTPMFSYGLTSYQIYRRKSTSGFSIDICLIMLLSSILKIMYYMMEPYEIALFRQAVVMIIVQCILLKVSLTYINTPIKLYEADKILTQSSSFTEVIIHYLKVFDNFYQRPYYFWQWFDNHNMYWQFLGSFTIALTVVTLLLQNFQIYQHFIGFLGLFVESLLPLPQILLIYRLKSIKNFKYILILSWLGGDATKIGYLLFGTNQVSDLFMAAALFQTALDLFIAGQFFYYKLLDNSNEFSLPF